MEQHETYASIIVERHRTIFETGGRGGFHTPTAALSREELLARTYEVGVTILATLGGCWVFRGGRCGARRQPCPHSDLHPLPIEGWPSTILA